MNDQVTLGTSTPLPGPPPGWFDYHYTVLWDGNLALVRSDRDIHAEFGRWRDGAQGRDSFVQLPTLHNFRLRLSKFDGHAEFGAIEVSAVASTKADYLPDGRWLVASARAARDEQNVRLFAVDGKPAGNFAIGDGIEHVRCAPDGTIWVGYFDEGVFKASNKDGSWPVSTSGIARFGPDGTVLWRFNDVEGPNLFIADCYALTLDGNHLWCCP